CLAARLSAGRLQERGAYCHPLCADDLRGRRVHERGAAHQGWGCFLRFSLCNFAADLLGAEKTGIAVCWPGAVSVVHTSRPSSRVGQMSYAFLYKGRHGDSLNDKENCSRRQAWSRGQNLRFCESLWL